MKKLNIFLSGKAGSGKTSIANFMAKKHGYKVVKFAQPIYSIAKDLFKMGNKDRELLQFLGTEVGRCIDNNIWITRFFQNLEIVEKYYILKGIDLPGFICDDCRFENEYKELTSEGWFGIFLNSDNEQLRKDRLIKRDGEFQEDSDKHVSELDSDRFKDMLLNINSSCPLQDLTGEVEKVYLILKQFAPYLSNIKFEE